MCDKVGKVPCASVNHWHLVHVLLCGYILVGMAHLQYLQQAGIH